MKGGAAWRVGVFALAGLALLALAVVLAGGQWFVARESALMRFTTSVYGLQVGAPVVFRGVRVGQITDVELGAAASGGVAVAVTAEFERALLRNLLGAGRAGGAAGVASVAGEVGSAGAASTAGAAGQADAGLVRSLVARGLVARLATQSLLTGQLYVDLDIDARAAAARTPAVAVGASSDASSSLPIIPTAPSQLQSLQAQLEGLDLAQVGRDLSALTASMRQLLAGPEPARLLARVADAAQSLQRLAERLEREVGPMARSAQAALGEGQRAASAVGQGAAQLARNAEQLTLQVSAAASQVQGQVGALSGAGVAALAQVQRSAEAVAQAAETLRGAAADDSTLRLQADRALADVSQAARALRELAELLERHPEALLRGRANTP